MAKRIKLICLVIFLLQTPFIPYLYKPVRQCLPAGKAGFGFPHSQSHAYAETDVQSDRIIATVNKDTITQSEADAFLNLIIMQLSQRYQGKHLQEKIDDEKKKLITQMIEEKIILQEAKRRHLEPRQDVLKKRIEQARKSYNSDADFEQALRLRGLTSKDLEKRMSEQMMVQQLIEQQVKSKIIVAPSQVTEYYEKHKPDFLQPEMRIIETLYFKDKNITERLTLDLKTDTDFNQLADRYKIAYAKDAVAKPQLKPEIQEAIFSLKINEISGLLEFNEGIYVFKLLEIQPEELRSLVDVHDWIYNYVLEQKSTVKLLEWLEELKSKAYIVVK